MYRMILPKFARYIMRLTELLLQNRTHILPSPQISWTLKCQRKEATCNNFKGKTQRNHMIVVTYMDVLSASVKEATSWAAIPSPWDTRPTMHTHRILEWNVILIIYIYYILANSTEHSLVQKPVDRHSATQESPWRFITVFKRTSSGSYLSQMNPDPIYWRSVLILSFHLHRSSKWFNLFRFFFWSKCYMYDSGTHSFPLICLL
jgi:hypothetical protein